MDPTMPGDDDLLSALSNMSDEDLKRLLQTSNVPNRSALVQQQLSRGQALMDAPQDNYRTGAGGMLGGMASVLRGGRGAYQATQAQDAQGALMGMLEDPRAARLTFGGHGGAPAAPAPTVGAAPGGAPAGDLSGLLEPLVHHRLGMGGAVGQMGMPGPMDKQQMLIQLLRSGGAGDMSALAGMA